MKRNLLLSSRQDLTTGDASPIFNSSVIFLEHGIEEPESN